MKWTPEKDQLLLLKILETHSLSVDAKRVAEAWPKSLGPDMPTPRAISERLVRMRNTARESSGIEGHFSIGKGLKTGSPMTKSTASAASSPASVSTPHKLRVSNARKGSALKRKRDDDDDDDEDGDVGEYTPTPAKMKVEGDSDTEIENGMDTPTKPMKGKGVSARPSAQLKKEVVDLESEAEVAPVKRVRKASALAPGMVEWKDEDDEGDGESSASEYVPEVEAKGEGVYSAEEFDDGDLYDA
ncbi:hypothetical protein BO79DRAFT_252449 [Aspergillus costaricaensis CBS 115574]|uniref:Uncharacterized protein n=1 Tax=Aspergillus costaricaensis CBS 115574 TaxID=1448317 RepID=A0ACD1INB9_9EURO|nr:hypothetical protein BO79DRAFT_252449 [Aspergillus costaricaensis CBS 115574]RAK91615.1 hypothetical protein BO79DRAFT_252449 [Aspergillus costaricaensis CBS 115574]